MARRLEITFPDFLVLQGTTGFQTLNAHRLWFLQRLVFILLFIIAILTYIHR